MLNVETIEIKMNGKSIYYIRFANCLEDTMKQDATKSNKSPSEFQA